MSEPSQHTIEVLRYAQRTSERQHHSHAVVIGACADSDFAFCQHVIHDVLADRAKAQLRAGVYARLSETYDAAESVPTQLECGTDHGQRHGWMVAATFKDDG